MNFDLAKRKILSCDSSIGNDMKRLKAFVEDARKQKSRSENIFAGNKKFWGLRFENALLIF